MRATLKVACCLLLLAVGTGGCNRDAGSVGATGFQGPASLHELGESVWTALSAGDTVALRRLRVTQAQHDSILWPEQRAERPALESFPLDLAWQNIQMRNRAALDELVPAFAGGDGRLVQTTCDAETRRFPSFDALAGCALIIEGPDGRRQQVEPFRYAIRLGDEFLVLRYYSD